MSDLIDRQAALDVVNRYDFKYPKYMERFVTELRDAMKADITSDLEDLPSAQQYMTATSNTMVSDTVKIPVMDGTTERLPSAQGDAEFIRWLLDEIWDEEVWELNYRAFPELLCRKLVKRGYLKEKDGIYIREGEGEWSR